MAKKEITVVINGEEFVSKAAQEAEAGLTLFGKRIPIVLDASALLSKGLELLRAGFAAAKDWVVDSLAAYDAYAASQRKLEGTSKLTGVALKDLQEIAKNGTDGFKLSTVTANEYSAEIAKLTSKAGDLGKSKDAMAAFLDIGAARGLNANETLKAVQQAILGIDEGTDKLFGKNPSVLYEEYATKIGKSAGKLSDQEKAMALLDATMEGGERVKGAYLEYLDSAAGQQDLLNQRIESSQVSFGQALQPIRTLVLQGLNKLLDILLPVVEWIGKASVEVGVTLVQSVNRGREVLGNLAAAVGKLTGMKDLQKWGEESAKSAQQSIKAVDETVRKAAEGTKVSADTVQTAHKATTRVTDAELKEQEKAWKKHFGELKATQQLVLDMMIGYQEAAKRLEPQLKKAYSITHMQSYQGAVDGVRESTDALMKATFKGGMESTKQLDEVRSKLRLANVHVSDMARMTLDAAQAFGVLDRETGAVLTSVINVGTAVDKMLAGGTSALFAGVPAVLSGVANIVTSMMQGDKERKELTRANTEALNKLRSEGVRLSNKATGEQIAGIAGLDADLIGMLGKMTSEVARNAGNQILTQMLAKAGLRLSDLDAVASELGFNLRRSNGQVELSQLPQFFAALQENLGALTRIGQTFSEQLDFFKESQRLSGASGTTQIADLLTFVQNISGSRAFAGIDMSDPAKAREQLFSLFASLNNNTLGAGDLGRLTGEQFRSLVVELIGLIDNLETTTEATTTDPSPTPQTTAVVESVEGVAVSVASVQDIISAMDAHVVEVLIAHTALHERIAAATESGVEHLASIDEKMDILIGVAGGQADRTNTALAAARAIAQTNAGQGPSF